MKARYLIMTAAMCSLSSTTWASGFALSGRTASNMGNGFSGTATLAEDASVVATNPAAMQDLEGSQFSAMLGTVMPNLRYKDKGSNTISTTTNTSVTDPHYIPNLYYVTALNSDVRFGFGIYAPFGLGLDYKDDWPGRYTTIGSDLKIINLSPAVSIKTSDKTSLAFGIDMQYLNATLKNAVDYGYFNGVPQTQDGTLELTGTNWAYGYTIGLIHDIDEANRIGLTFHSSTRQDVSGDADFEGRPTIPAVPADWFTDTGGDITLVLPETLNLGYRRTVSSQLQVMVDATWTRWSRYDELVVEFDNGTPNSRTEQNWNDVWRLSVGANYQLDETWLLRGGLSYDPTPVPDAEHRSARIPDGDRLWVTLGSRTKLDSNMDLDLALAYAPDTKYKIDSTNSTLGHNLNGEYTSQILYVMAQFNWKF